MKPMYLTVADVADRWNVSKMTVYRLIHDGDLHAVRIGRSFRVAVRDMLDYERGGTSDGAR